MRNLAKFIAILTSLLGIFFILLAFTLVFSEYLQNNPDSSVHAVIAMSCWLYPYSLYLLLGMFILLGLEFRLRRQRMKTGTATLSGWPKWKYFLLSEKDPLPLESLLSSLGRLLFFLALGSQLVWLWFQEGCV